MQRLSGRWAQTGSLWRQLLRQWLLLEPLLRQLPQQSAGAPLLQAQLQALEAALESGSGSSTAALSTPAAASSSAWLEEAAQLQAAAPLLLAIGQQISQLQQLLHSRSLALQAIARRGSR